MVEIKSTSGKILKIVPDADLRYANLRNANLRNANLCGANLRNVNLRNANLSGANLRYANLSGADLSGANLSGADLSGADLSGANLRYADLSGADLSGADLSAFSIVPDKGSFLGFKKLRNGGIATLRIGKTAKRVSSLVGRKCRTDRAKVISIEGGTGAHVSSYDDSFVYAVGKIVTPLEPFNDDIRIECASGIHFFLTRNEAEDY